MLQICQEPEDIIDIGLRQSSTASATISMTKQKWRVKLVEDTHWLIGVVVLQDKSLLVAVSAPAEKTQVDYFWPASELFLATEFQVFIGHA